MKEYFTTWIVCLYIIKYILQFLGTNGHKYINLYYLSIILLYGYIIFIIIDMNIKNEKYDKYVYLINGILHIIPLWILCLSGNINTKYAFETMFLLFILYVIYLTSRDTHIVSVYTDNRKRLRTIDEIMKYFHKN